MLLLLTGEPVVESVQVKQIVITSPAGTGNQAYVGVGFQGKLLLIHAYSSAAGGTGSLAGAGIMFGAATSSTNRCFASGISGDAATAGNSHARRSDTACVGVENAAGTLQIAADFVSWDADGFTLNWTTAETGHTLVCTVIGGSDVSAVCGNSAAPASTGSQSVTGLSFKPNTLILFDSRLSNTAIPGNGTMWRPQFGLVDAAGGSYAWAGNSQDSADPTVTSQIMSSSSCMIGTATAAGATDRRATFTSYNSDGFTLNWVTLDGTVGVNSKYLYVAMNVPSSKVGTTAQRTTTGTTQVTGLGFSPLAMMFGITGLTATGGTNSHRIGLGLAAGTGSGDQYALAVTDGNALATSDVGALYTSGKAIQWVTGGASPSATSQANISAKDSDSFTLNWTTVDATARLVGYLAMGMSTGTVTVGAVTGSGMSAVTPTSLDMDLNVSAVLGAGMAAVAPSGVEQSVAIASALGTTMAAVTPTTLETSIGIDLLGSAMTAVAPDVQGTGALSVTLPAVLGSGMTAPAPQVDMAISINAVLGTTMGVLAPTTMPQEFTVSLLGSGMTAPAPMVGFAQSMSISAVLGVTMEALVPDEVSTTGAPFTDGWLMTLGVGGRRWLQVEGYLFGAIKAETAEPYDVMQEQRFHDTIEIYWVLGDFRATYVEPYEIEGGLALTTVEQYNVLDGTVGVFEEGGIATPQAGWYDPWAKDEEE